MSTVRFWHGLAQIVDQQARDQLNKIQQAFVSGRDISNANVATHEQYFNSVERQVLQDFLRLDCTKRLQPYVVEVDRGCPDPCAVA